MIDMAADQGWLATSIQLMTVVQMVVQGRWHTDSSLLTLPRVNKTSVGSLESRAKVGCLPEFVDAIQTQRGRQRVRDVLRGSMSNNHADEIISAAGRVPIVNVAFKVGAGHDAENLVADEEYALDVTLSRESGSSNGGLVRMARLGKPVNEGWWLVLGERDTGELLALKRLGGLRGRTMSTSLAFFTAEEPGDATYTLYLVSDCYIGLDQQYDIHVSAKQNEFGDAEYEVDDGADIYE